MAVQENSHPLENTTAYVHGGVIYVPKYVEPGVYVGPGYPRHTKRSYTKNELVQAGAVPTEMMLWPRVKKALPSIGG